MIEKKATEFSHLKTQETPISLYRQLQKIIHLGHVNYVNKLLSALSKWLTLQFSLIIKINQEWPLK